MNGVDRRGAAARAAPIKDPDLLMYRDLAMLELVIRDGLRQSDVAALFRIDRSLVSRRLRAIPDQVVRGLRIYLSRARREGRVGLEADEFEALKASILALKASMPRDRDAVG